MDEDVTKAGQEEVMAPGLEHLRWCPTCVCRIHEHEVRVRADGKPRHAFCDEVVKDRGPVVGVALEDIPAGADGIIDLNPLVRGLLRAAETPEPVFTCTRCGGRYPVVGGTLVAHDHPGTGRCAGSGTVPAMQGGPIHMRGEVGPELLFPHRRENFGEPAIDWGRFGPAVQASVEARLHAWVTPFGKRDCYCRRLTDHTEEPLSDLQAWADTQTADLRADVEGAVRAVDDAGPRIPEPLIVSFGALVQTLAADLRRLIPQVTGAKLHTNDTTLLAAALVETGWVPGARRRADAVDELAKYARDPETGAPVTETEADR